MREVLKKPHVRSQKSRLVPEVMPRDGWWEVSWSQEAPVDVSRIPVSPDLRLSGFA